MNRITMVILGAVVVVGLGESHAIAADEPKIEGSYNCVGDNGAGQQYTGEVEISKEGDVYNEKWTIAGGTHVGIGIRTGDVLSVSWATEGFAGVVVYKIEKGGKLSGKWSQFGAKGVVLTETLTPK